MAKREVRVCDRCGKEVDYFNSVGWSVATITLPKYEGKLDEATFDLCTRCTGDVKAYVVTTPSQPSK